jgi:hypothetical protein
MEKIYNLFKFIEDKYPEYRTPFKYKIIYEIPITEEELNIEGDLDLDDSHVTSLPDNLTISGYLFLRRCTKLRSLPNNLTVSIGVILVGCTNLKRLGRNLSIGGGIILKNTPIAEKYTEAEIKEMCPGIGGNIII